MAFVVLYDARVLYPAPLRDLLLRLSAVGDVLDALRDNGLVQSVARLRAMLRA